MERISFSLRDNDPVYDDIFKKIHRLYLNLTRGIALETTLRLENCSQDGVIQLKESIKKFLMPYSRSSDTISIARGIRQTVASLMNKPKFVDGTLKKEIYGIGELIDPIMVLSISDVFYKLKTDWEDCTLIKIEPLYNFQLEKIKATLDMSPLSQYFVGKTQDLYFEYVLGPTGTQCFLEKEIDIYSQGISLEDPIKVRDCYEIDHIIKFDLNNEPIKYTNIYDKNENLIIMVDIWNRQSGIKFRNFEIKRYFKIMDYLNFNRDVNYGTLVSF